MNFVKSPLVFFYLIQQSLSASLSIGCHRLVDDGMHSFSGAKPYRQAKEESPLSLILVFINIILEFSPMFKDLNFPSFQFRIEKAGDKLVIFDVLRKKRVTLTPEEWVRQHMIRYLIDFKGYPKALIRVESSLKYDKMEKRSDILVYDHQGDPFMVIECKSPEVKLDDKVLHQVAAYSKSLKVKYLGVSNGMKHYCWAIDHAHQTSLNLEDFPPYE